MSECLIRIVDDDSRALEAVSFMLQCEGYETAVYESARDFLVEDTPTVGGCVLSDIRMPGMTGIELLNTLNERSYRHPLLLMTAYADLEMAVDAMKLGAVDYFVKPVNPEKLISGVVRALKLDRQRHAGLTEDIPWKDRWQTLTEREAEVLEWVAKGYLSRQIAIELDISQRTVEVHRAKGMKKLGVTTPAQLALLISSLDNG